MNREIFRHVLLSTDLRPVPANPAFQAVLFYVDRYEKLGVHFPHSMVVLSMN